MSEHDHLLHELESGPADDPSEWPVRGPECPSIGLVMDIAANKASPFAANLFRLHLQGGCAFCRLHFASLQKSEVREEAVRGGEVRPAAPEPFQEEWQPALAAGTGSYEFVRTVRLLSGGAEVRGWIEWSGPSGGYWHARLRFPGKPAGPFGPEQPLARFAGLAARLTVCRAGKKLATLRGQLRLEQDDLTSTWLPVQLADGLEPKEYEFDLRPGDQPSGL